MTMQQQWQSHQTQLQNIIDREIDDVINGTMVKEDDIECAEDEIFMDEKDDHHCVDYDDIEEDGVIDSVIDHAADDSICDATDDVDDMDAGIPSSSSCSFDGLLSSADTASRRFCPSRIYTNHTLITDVLSSSAIHGGDLIKLQHISEEKRVSSSLTPQQSNSSYSHGPMPTGTSIISQSQASGQVTLLMNSVHSPPLQTLSSLSIASAFIESTSKVVPTPSHVNTTSSVSLTDSLTHSPSHLNPRHSHYASPRSSICSSPVISSDSNLTSSSQWPKSKFSSVSGHRAFFQRIRRLELAIQEREGEGEYVEDKNHVNGTQSRMDGKSSNSSRNDSTRAIESTAILDLKESHDDTANTHPQLTISSSSSMDGNKDAMCSVSVNSVDPIPCHTSLSSHLSIRIHPITNDSLNHTPGSQIDLPLTTPADKVFLSQSTIGETNSSNSILSASIGEVELPSQLYPSSIIPLATMLSQSTDGDSSQMISPSVPSSYSNHPVSTSSSHLHNNAKTVDDACNASNSHAADGDHFHLHSYDPWSCSFLPLSHRSRIAVRASHPNCASWLTRIEAILVELANSRTDLLAFTKLSHFHHHILSHGDELEKELLPLNRTRSQSIDPIIHSASLKWPSSSSSSSSPSSYSIPFTLLHSSWLDWIRNYRLDHVHPMPSNSFTQAKQDQNATNNNLSPRRDCPVQSSHQGPLSSIAASIPLPLPLPLTSQSSDFEFI